MNKNGGFRNNLDLHSPRQQQLISFGKKLSGKPCAGKRHPGFDVAPGIGNVNMGVGLRARTKALELPPNPKVNAPVPTLPARGWR
ncbi:MAG: hypothetical protein FDX02_06720 [Chlorobium sp.]|nr:MAG: hypothetical protein FDX02_06720 [Chlorobium sp.]